jgi:uncharacterized membrane protein
MRDWRLFLRHNHWLTLRVGGHAVQICARCSGTVIGYFSSIVLGSLVYALGFNRLGSTSQLLVALAFAAPSGVDWVSQTWRLRLSTNNTRFMVGLLIGFGAGLLGLSALTREAKIAFMTSTALVVVSAGYLGRGFARLTRLSCSTLSGKAR